MLFQKIGSDKAFSTPTQVLIIVRVDGDDVVPQIRHLHEPGSAMIAAVSPFPGVSLHVPREMSGPDKAPSAMTQELKIVRMDGGDMVLHARQS